MKKALVLFTLSLFVLTGCSNVLIADNTVLPVETGEDNTAKVKQLTTYQPGQIASMAPDRKSLYSIGRSGSSYTIDLFDLKSSNLVNQITSDTQILGVAAASDGLYYLKENTTKTIQIIWSSNNRLIERTVTDPAENPQKAIYVYNDKDIVYINNANELVFSDSSGVKKTYSFDESLEVEKIYWIERIHCGFMLAKEAGSEISNLYRFTLEEYNASLELVDQDVIDLALNNDRDRLIYATNSDEGVHVYLKEDQYLEGARDVFITRGIESISFSLDSSKIYFLKTDENEERSTIWCYLLDSKKLYQISSPLRITSALFSPSAKDELYFSVEKYSYVQPADITLINSYIMKLVYELKK